MSSKKEELEKAIKDTITTINDKDSGEVFIHACYLLMKISLRGLLIYEPSYLIDFSFNDLSKFSIQDTIDMYTSFKDKFTKTTENNFEDLFKSKGFDKENLIFM